MQMGWTGGTRPRLVSSPVLATAPASSLGSSVLKGGGIRTRTCPSLLVPMHFLRLSIIALTLTAPTFAVVPATVFIPKGAEWKYLDDGSDQGTAWRAATYDDSNWKSGKAKLGFSDGAVTTLNAGQDPKHKFITYYFRKEFTVADPKTIPDLHLELLRDDGAVVYLNGAEVARSNLPAGAILPATPAKAAVAGAAEVAFHPFKLNPAKLAAGRNVIAVEVHQNSGASSDLGFDLELVSPATLPPATTVATGPLSRGPYLQQAAPTSITVRWRTRKPNLGVVRYGSGPAALGQAAQEASDVTDHGVTLTGLTPRTTYYYSIGTATETLAGGDATTLFTTPPPQGTPQNTRIWVLGDAGTKTIHQARVRNAFYTFTGGRIPDFCLLLGDNAYDRGTDAEYQKALFEVYPAMLRRVPFWSCLSNHETAQSVSYVNTYAYFDVFTFPTNGECGGVPSGTEHFFSFDYGNIHLISLDSMTANRSPTGPMATWLTQDLAATTATWIIATFHHPPYTKGSHNSDVERELVEMRRNILPILEQGGTDLVLNGHSHCYERSGLLDGHYGLSTTFNAAMRKQPGIGRADGDGAYIKPLTGPKAHQGTIYNVAGSAGQISGGKLNHPAMLLSLNQLGSVVLDIEGNRLNSTFLGADGLVRDTYSIIKQDAK